MIHTGIIQINGRWKMAMEEVFRDDRRCAVLDTKNSPNAGDSRTVMHGKYRNVGQCPGILEF
jgi:hypothetical protein